MTGGRVVIVHRRMYLSHVLVVTFLSACTYSACLPHHHFRALQGAKDVQVKGSASVAWF